MFILFPCEPIKSILLLGVLSKSTLSKKFTNFKNNFIIGLYFDKLFTLPVPREKITLYTRWVKLTTKQILLCARLQAN